MKLTQCEDGSYCCGSVNQACCDGGQGIRFSNTSDPDTSATTSPDKSTSTASNNNAQSSHLTQKAVIGIAVGCSVIGAIVAGSAVWFFFVQKRKRDTTLKNVEPEERNPVYEVDLPYSDFSPLPADLVLIQLDTNDLLPTGSASAGHYEWSGRRSYQTTHGHIRLDGMRR